MEKPLSPYELYKEKIKSVDSVIIKAFNSYLQYHLGCSDTICIKYMSIVPYLPKNSTKDYSIFFKSHKDIICDIYTENGWTVITGYEVFTFSFNKKDLIEEFKKEQNKEGKKLIETIPLSDDEKNRSSILDI